MSLAASPATPGAGAWPCAPPCRLGVSAPGERAPCSGQCESGAAAGTEMRLQTLNQPSCVCAAMLSTGASPAGAKAAAVPGAAAGGWETKGPSRPRTWPGRNGSHTQLPRPSINQSRPFRAPRARCAALRPCGISATAKLGPYLRGQPTLWPAGALPQLGGGGMRIPKPPPPAQSGGDKTGEPMVRFGAQPRLARPQPRPRCPAGEALSEGRSSLAVARFCSRSDSSSVATGMCRTGWSPRSLCCPRL